MSAQKISAQIGVQDSSTYHPDSLSDDQITLDTDGTRIVLTGVKKRASQTPTALRKRLARRFSIIGPEYNFTVSVNGVAVQITDRDCFHKLQYLWYYGEESEQYAEFCSSGALEHDEEREGKISVQREENAEPVPYQVTGWIGTTVGSGDLQDGDDNLNKIVIMARGKLIQEDILEAFTEGGLYTKYLVGEIHADFLDLDDQDDIATSNRQEIIKDDPRYLALRNWIKKELNHIRRQWTKLRNEKGVKEATQIPAINEWMNGLKGDGKKQAKSLFGKIGELTLDENKRIELYQYCVLAFESLMYKDRLAALENLSPQNIKEITKIFAEQAELEASRYYQIVNDRLYVIKALHRMVEDNVLEQTIQNFLPDHFWLLDPAWERASDALYMEQQVATAFDEVSDQLSPEEKSGRIDIRYKKMSGQHVIIELKRPDQKMNDFTLMGQVDKYRTALQKQLNLSGDGDDSIEIVCIVGKELREWTNSAERAKSKRSLAEKNIRIVLYRELIKNARQIYQEFLQMKEEAGRICKLIKNIEIAIQ